MARPKELRLPQWWVSVRLNVRGYRAALALWKYADGFGHCYPGTKALRRDSGLDQRELFRALDELVEQGLLSIKPGDEKNTNHYWLSLLPDEIALTKREKRGSGSGTTTKKHTGVVGLEPRRVVGISPVGVVGLEPHKLSSNYPYITTMDENEEEETTEKERFASPSDDLFDYEDRRSA